DRLRHRNGLDRCSADRVGTQRDPLGNRMGDRHGRDDRGVHGHRRAGRARRAVRAELHRLDLPDARRRDRPGLRALARAALHAGGPLGVARGPVCRGDVDRDVRPGSVGLPARRYAAIGGLARDFDRVRDADRHFHPEGTGDRRSRCRHRRHRARRGRVANVELSRNRYDAAPAMRARLDIRLLALPLLLLAGVALAHTVAEGDQDFVRNSAGAQIVPFIYLGAKHMVTGYDHLLFLAGVIFFLYRLKEVALYVTLFAVGHSSTLLLGVLTGLHVNPFLIDAIIGLSVVYKALDNMDAFRTMFGWQPNAKLAVLVFGFFHGFGLATKLQELNLAREGLVSNMLAFNVGVEIGQLLALSAILLIMNYWRRTASFTRHAYGANVVLLTAGFVLTG